MNAIKEAALNGFKDNYESIMAGEYRHELARDPKCRTINLLNACQAVLRRRIYPLREVVRVELMGRHVIHELMDLFWEAAKLCSPDDPLQVDVKTFPGKLLSLISSNYRLAYTRAMKDNDLPERYCRLQLLTDQVAGMTDTYACTLHRQLTNSY